METPIAEPTEQTSTHAIVEIFGHQMLAGEIQKIEMFGTPMVRVSVPATEDRPAFTRDFNPSAIYSITYVSAEIAALTAKQLNVKPVSIYIPEIDDLSPLRAENTKLKRTIAQLTGALPAPSAYSEA